MKYLFFDIECANCLSGEGKICSFGYVITDEEFRVLKMKDILINPVAPFLLGNAKTGDGITLAYPLFRFKNAPIFPHFYLEIKRLLEDEDTLCFGFAVSQDVSYLLYSCKRYQLPLLMFSFFDIQKLEQMIYHRKNPSSLDHLVEQFHAKAYTYHRSDYDALMSMEVLKGILEQNSLTLSEAVNKYADCFSNCVLFLKQQERRKEIKERRRKHQEKVQTFFSHPDERKLEEYDAFFWNNKFFFTSALLFSKVDILLEHKNAFYSRGGLTTKRIEEADYLVFSNLNSRDNIKEETLATCYGKRISFSEFLAKLLT